MNRREVLRLLGLPAFAPTLGLSSVPWARAGQITKAGRPDVEFTLAAAPAEASILPRRPTSVWRFSGVLDRGPSSTIENLSGSYLGPTIRVRRGQRVRVRFRNQLDEPSIVHWHGLDVPERADGHPRLAVAGGGEYIYDFEVTNRAGTYWYHPHPHQRTGAQVYRGLAGLLVVSDSEEEALGLPTGSGELTCVIQDRRFDTQNQLVYAGTAGVGRDDRSRGRMGDRGRGMMGRGMGGGMAQAMETMNGWLGDRVLVNGRLQPALDVVRRTYRLRLLNGSNARIYKLGWSDGTPFTIIGGDGGLLERAFRASTITLAPGQRSDVLVELSDRQPGTSLGLRSVAFPASAVGHVGMMDQSPALPQGAAVDLMTFTVGSGTGPRVRLPDRLSTMPAAWRVDAAAPVRTVALTFRQMEWLLGGRTFEMDGVAREETVEPGSTHVWELQNEPNPMGMAMAHPIHLHGPQFRVLSRAGGKGNALADGIADSGLTDTVLVLPGQTVRLQVTFSRHPGLYLYHCHILEHEDMGMMRNFRITGRPSTG